MADNTFCRKLVERIKASDLWVSGKSKEGGRHLSGLKCPECGHAEASAYVEGPFAILCSRKNSCGARVRTLELFPELIEKVERDFKPTPDDPHRPAREYLYSRGLTNKSLEGLRFEYRRDIRKCGSGGVLFYVGVNSAGKEVWNGRIFAPPQGIDKGHNSGATAGVYWRHPGLVYDPNRPTFIKEGVIDALSLIEMGLQAIAVLSSVQDPSKLDLGGLEKNLVIAFDPDHAGCEGLRKWIAVYPSAKSMIHVEGDSNDLLRSRAPGKAREAFDAAIPEMKCRARLALAEKAQDYAEIFYDFYGFPPGLFEFQKSYWFSGVMKDQVYAQRVSNFTCAVDHYALDASNPENPVNKYHLCVKPVDGKPTYCTITGPELTHPWSLRSALLTYARALWEGEAKATMSLASRIIQAKSPVVRQVHVLGHDEASNCVVFRDFLIDPDGKMLEPDAKGFFRASRKEFLGPPKFQTVLPKSGESLSRIYQLINGAWPNNGALAIAFAVASWFVWTVKPTLGFFPFLSLHGDPQTGKSYLVRRLNAMQALDEEGLPMTKLNTGKGEIRQLAQRSGLFKALLEGNKAETLRFDLETILTLYNAGNPLQVRAIRDNGLGTLLTQFQSSLIFVQNKEPFKSKAQMERVVSSAPFKVDDINGSSTDAFRAVQRIPIREMAWCYVETMRHRRDIEAEWYEGYVRARNEILDAVPDNRIAENHGLMLCFHRIAEKIFGAKLDLRPFLTALAERKHRQCNHRQANLADHFFEAVDEIAPKTSKEFVCLDDGKMYVRMALALKSLDGNGYKFYAAQLYQELKEHPAFVTSNVNKRAYWGEEMTDSVQKVWIFDANKLDVEEGPLEGMGA